MTGVDIIGELLAANEAVTAAIPPAQMKSGALPEKFALPVLLLRLVSSVEVQPLKRGPTVRTIDRVSVTVRAGNYIDQGAVIRLVRKACAGRTGDVAGGLRVSVLTAGTGPDVRGPGNTYEQSQDFRVSFDAPA